MQSTDTQKHQLVCKQASMLEQAQLAKAQRSRLELRDRMKHVVDAFNQAEEGLESRKRSMKEHRKWVRPPFLAFFKVSCLFLAVYIACVHPVQRAT